MGKKKFRFAFDCPFTLIFALVATAVFLLDTFALKGKAVAAVFSCPGAKGVDPFRFTNPLHYARLFLHVAGSGLPYVFLSNLTVFLLLGPRMERKFGTPMLALMSGISALVSGVLNACLGSATVYGMEPLALLVIFLCIAEPLMKRSLDVPYVLAFAAYIGFILYASSCRWEVFLTALIFTATSLAGGICGGIPGFLVSPKTTKEKSTPEKTVPHSEVTVVDPRTKRERRTRKIKKVKVLDDVPSETEIGTL